MTTTDATSPAEREPQTELVEWTAMLLDGLGLDPSDVDIDAVLALAGRAAHGVVRPAAPVTTFAVGYAAGLLIGAGLHDDGGGAERVDKTVAVDSVQRRADALLEEFTARRAPRE
ncbi:DUF6457 domain-containing protein [Herbiconiux solani]|uniref:DUF6457 domain-containing protein n=1 Tax=Herbiconiux solani TaxID=661329 RepID=UPI000B079833|nr:DUF6457 domain-containing protein [Herbiconiux solani]